MKSQKLSCLSGCVATAAVLFLTSNALLVSAVAQSTALEVGASQIAAPAGPFLVAPSFSVAASPASVAMGDLNQDGKLDLVTTDTVSGKIIVSVGAGNGRFAPGVEYATGSHPGAVAVADLNGDGHFEVIVGDESKNTISVFSVDSEGGLQLRQTLATSISPAFLATGDFNADGKTDLAIAARTGTSLAITLNDGKGNLLKPAVNALHKTPTALFAADLNNDGHADLALANADGTVSVLLGAGTGNFHALPDFAVAAGPLSSIVATDLDRDGNIDLAVTQSGAKTISVLLGKGNGSFAAPRNYAVGRNPVSSLISDLDGDGVPDLIVVNQGSNTYSVLGGNGDGTFKSSLDFVVGNGPLAAVAGDFSGAGHVDLAVVNPLSQSVSVPLGKGDGTFAAARSYFAGFGPRSIASADVNGDKLPDLVVANYCGSDAGCSKGGSVAVFLAKSDGTYQLSKSYSVGNTPVSLALVDVNGDKSADIVALNREDRTVSVLLSNSDGSFQDPYTFSVVDSPVAIAVGDLNGDGKSDLAVLGDCGAATCSQPGSVEVLLGHGDGNFSSSSSYAVGYSPSSIAIGDLNQDKNVDIVVANRCGKDASCNSAGTASVLLGGVSGKFTAAADVAVGKSPSSIALGSMSGAAVPDLLVTSSSSNTVSILHGNGNGTFQAPKAYKVGNSPGSIVMGDFDGDGKPDIAVANLQDSTVSVLYGKGDGTLGSASTLPVGAGPEALAAITSAASKRASLATANGNSGSPTPGTDVTVLANIQPEATGAPFTPTISLALTTGTSSAVFGTPLTFTATVTGPAGFSGPTGTVTFADGGTTLTCSNSGALTAGTAPSSTATCDISTLSIGAHALTASYNPGTDPNFVAAGPSTGVQQTITKATPTITVALTTGTSSAGFGTPLTFTATVTGVTGLAAPTGTVTFADGGAALTCSNSGALAAGAGVISSGTCNISTLAVGAHSITATYVPGSDPDYLAVGPSQSVSETITKATPTISVALTTGNSSSAFGTALTFTATVTGATGLSAPTGSVTFADGGTALTCTNPGTLAAGSGLTSTGTCNISTLTIGTHSITATYVPGTDPNYLAVGPSSSISQTITKAKPTIAVALTSGSTPSTLGSSLTFTATVTGITGLSAPTGSVTFDDGTTALTCTNSGTLTAGSGTSSTATCVIAKLGVGTHQINATYVPGADPNFIAAGPSTSITQTVSKAAPTIAAALTSGTNPSTFGSPLVFTATVNGVTGQAAPTGSVTFADGGTALTCTNPGTLAAGSGATSTATCSIATLSVAAHSITASYVPGADPNYVAAGPSTAVSQTVNKFTPSISVSLTHGTLPPTAGESLTFTATVAGQAGVTQPTGTVLFNDADNSNSVVCTTPATLVAGTTNSTASCTVSTLSASAHAITATYTPASADTNYLTAGPSTAFTLSVGKTTPTVSVASTLNPSTYGSAVIFNATLTNPSASTGVTQPTGTVTFLDGANALTCSNANSSTVTQGTANSTASCAIATLTGGSHTITVQYQPGTDPTYLAATGSLASAQRVNTFTPTVAVTGAPSPATYGTNITFTATVTGVATAGTVQPTGTVTFLDGANALTCSTGGTLAQGSTSSVATCSTSALLGGTHNISATYIPGADTNYATAAAAAPFPETVNGAGTTTTVTLPATAPVVDQPATFTATVQPSVTGGANPTGTVTFAVTQSGNVVNACPNPIHVSTAASVTSASCTGAALPASGQYSVTATYSGDGNYQGGASTPQTGTVGPAASTVTVTTTPSSSVVNQSVTFKVQVAPAFAGTTQPTGNVSFADSTGQTLCAPTALVPGATNSTATCSVSLLTAGTHTVTVTYPGDGNFSSGSGTVNQVVNQDSTTITVTSSAPTIVATQSVTFTATVVPANTGTAAPSGAITFSLTQGGTSYACAAGGSLPPNGPAPYAESCTISFPNTVSGNVAVTATYAGDSNFSTSTSAAITQVVQNFSSSVTPTTLTMAQGSVSTANTNLTDPFNATPITISSTGLNGSTDPVTVTSCAVLPDTNGDAIPGLTCSFPASNGVALITATSATPVGSYTVQLTVADAKVPTLVHIVGLTINIINFATQASTPIIGTTTATFSVAAPLPADATLSFGDVSIANLDGTYTVIPISEIGVSLGSISPVSGSTTQYQFTITAGTPATAQLSTSHTMFAAAAVGVPFLFVVSLLPGVRKQRKALLRYLGMVILAFAAMHSIGCSSGGFTKSSAKVGVVGSYVIQIISTQNGTQSTVAVVPLVIEQ